MAGRATGGLKAAAKKSAVPAAAFVEPQAVTAAEPVGDVVTDETTDEETDEATDETTDEATDEAGEAGEAGETSVESGPADPWAALPAAVVRTRPAATGSGATLDVEKETPQAIKDRLYESYGIYWAGTSVEGASKGAIDKATRAAWREQQFASQEQMDLFVKLAKRYCAKRAVRWTFRSGPAKNGQGVVVPLRLAFLVKTFEAKQTVRDDK